MNTHLKKLFDKYNISIENRHDILQIFSVLPDTKRQNLLNNFEALAIKLQKIEEELEVERNILLSFVANKNQKA
jgi:hypothetical protein